MSLSIEPDNEDDYEYEDDYDNEEEVISDLETNFDLLNLHEWLFIYEVGDNKYSCNIILPNPDILGLEKSYEICEFLFKEINLLITKEYYGDKTTKINKTLHNCIFLIEDFITKRLKL